MSTNGCTLNAERRTQNAERRISVIVPTLNAEKYLSSLISSLHNQTIHPEIIVIDSESDDRTAEIASSYDFVKFVGIKRKDFNHALTRDKALRMSTGDYVIFITQDALPADELFIERIIYPFSVDDAIAVSTGRQIPRPDAVPFEKLVRTFNYPPVSNIRSSADIPTLGIKTFFTSDCCCAYRRDIFLKLGGFGFPVSMSEDMFFAAKAIHAGYKVAYAHDAGVIHSHNLTLSEQYRRNFLIGYETEKHKDILAGVSQEKEGVKLVKYVSRELLKHGRVWSFIRFGFDCVARLLGNRAGKKAYRKEAQKNPGL